MAGKHLDAERIVDTVQILGRRIRERFPEAGLNHVCADLLEIAKQARSRAERISEPMYGIRAASCTIVSLILLAFGYAISLIRIPDQQLRADEFLQMLDAGFNALVLIGASLLFLITLEIRIKRSRALKAIHELRSLSHIIDMHQLTKDPERTIWKGQDTESSPRRNMTPFQLNRYLDYCSEMLALAGKIAALYVENFPDSQTVAAVNDVEDLTSGLSRKIWQKIMILQETATVEGAAKTAQKPEISGSDSPSEFAEPPVS
ncbi:MAG: hypothetical protein KDA80_00940 [Planctomycetaceae bacterium]|nr:hypothetical protein [Planctomycetaceae bacterium]